LTRFGAGGTVAFASLETPVPSPCSLDEHSYSYQKGLARSTVQSPETLQMFRSQIARVFRGFVVHHVKISGRAVELVGGGPPIELQNAGSRVELP
jgi:hypothetical protein